MRSRRRSSAGLQSLADPEYLEGQQRVAPGIGPVYGVRWPLMAAVARGFRGATREVRPRPLLFVADRLFREDRPRAALVRVRPPRAHARPGPGAHLAAPAPCGARGRRLDHRRRSRPSVRQGHRRRAVPLGRARAARLLAVALGAAPRRLDDRDDDPRRSPPRSRSGGRRARDPAAAPADGRCRARRPEGAVVGLALAHRRGHGRDGRGASRARPSSRPRPMTATAPG